MKTGFVIIVATWFLFFGKTLLAAQIHQVQSVKAEFEGFNTETVFDVSCEAFDNTFKDTKETKVFNDESSLAKFTLLTKAFEQTTARSLDVRGTITFNQGKTHDKYCFTVFGYFYKDGKFYYNKKLLIYLSDRLYGNHPKYLDTLRQQ